MKSLSHFAEPYSAQGNIDARAAAKAIGRPQMDQWDVFLRETLQNSWDARLSDDGKVSYSVDAFWPDARQLKLLREVVFPHVLPDSELATFLEADGDSQPLLVVSDTGTKGLGGPTRADLVTEDSTDFVDFVRNVGRAADKALGGGTYGFGKGILWQMSACATVLIYSKSTIGGQPVTRFIAMGHTDSYAEGEQRYTGRHWWGRPDDITMVEPVEGPEAEELARALGMERLDGHDTGTAIMVLGPRVSDAAETLDAIVDHIARAALWWAWPHMVDRSIDFEFTSDGEVVECSRPEDDPTIKYFAQAYVRTSGMEQSVEEWPWHQEVLRMQRPEARLGSLVWRRVATEDLGDEDIQHVRVKSNIALMRRPRFIVRYLSVQDDPHGLGTVGVFVADGALDESFASAEPVAHDDWAPAHMALPKGSRNPVKRALELVKLNFAKAAVQVPIGDADGRRQNGIVRLATSIGDLVSGTGDPSIKERKPSSPGVPTTMTVSLTGRPVLKMVDGRPVATFQVKAKVPAGSAPARVRASPYVLTEAGPDADPDLDQPELLGWRGDGTDARRGFILAEDGEHLLEVDVTVPPDTAVSMSLSIAENGESE